MYRQACKMSKVGDTDSCVSKLYVVGNGSQNCIMILKFWGRGAKIELRNQLII